MRAGRSPTVLASCSPLSKVEGVVWAFINKLMAAPVTTGQGQPGTPES